MNRLPQIAIAIAKVGTTIWGLGRKIIRLSTNEMPIEVEDYFTQLSEDDFEIVKNS